MTIVAGILCGTRDRLPRNFMKMAENQTGQKIKAVQSDKNTVIELDNLFKECRIRRRLTVVHTLE